MGLASLLLFVQTAPTLPKSVLRHDRHMLTPENQISSTLRRRQVLGREYETLARPRQSGLRAALRVLLASRSILERQRTANRNALTALLRCIDLGIDARRPLTDRQSIASWRTNGAHPSADGLVISRREARRLARAVLEQTETLKTNHRQLQQLTEELAPGLQDIAGVGPMTGAILVCAYSHHGRVRSEAAFAMLGGVAPLPASSGNTSRYRLSRSGDRQLNRAFDTIVRTRMSFDPATHDYVARRQAEGRSNREIRRSLKRCVCRTPFRFLQTTIST
jgi:transposase